MPKAQFVIERILLLALVLIAASVLLVPSEECIFNQHLNSNQILTVAIIIVSVLLLAYLED